MAYGDFTKLVISRGATHIVRTSAEKKTSFEFEGMVWECDDKNRILMTGELADGYEMKYCLALYCPRKEAD